MSTRAARVTWTNFVLPYFLWILTLILSFLFFSKHPPPPSLLQIQCLLQYTSLLEQEQVGSCFFLRVGSGQPCLFTSFPRATVGRGRLLLYRGQWRCRPGRSTTGSGRTATRTPPHLHQWRVWCWFKIMQGYTFSDENIHLN